MRWWWWRPLDTCYIFIVVIDWKNSPRVDMSLHSYIFSWFRANQFSPRSNSLMLGAYCRNINYQFYMSLVWLDRGLNPIEASTPTITQRPICILIMQKMNICLLDSTCIEMSYCFWCNRYIGCYIFNTVLLCAKSMMLRKKKLTQNAGSCTTWFIRQFLFGIDPFYYQCVTAHIKWKWPEQARKVSGYVNVLGSIDFV